MSPRDDRGSSIATVLAISFIGTLIAVTVIEYALADARYSVRDRDWTSSLYSAEAGLNGYLWAINDDPQYFQSNIYPGEGTWTAVPEGEGEYLLRVIQHPKVVGKEMSITIESTGRVNGIARRVQVDLSRRSFLEWMYFTDYESYTGGNCLRYNQAPPDCGAIDFIGADTLDGPIKSNDWIRYCGSPTFMSTVESGRGGLYRSNSCSTPGSPNLPAGPAKECGVTPPACPSDMPLSNSKLQNDAIAGGYVYWGPIEITPTSNGRVRIYSKNGANGEPPSSVTSTDAANRTPTPNGSEVNFPPNGVIYVMNKTTAPTSSGTVYIRGTVRGQLTVGSADDIYVWKDIVYYDTSSNSRDVIGLIANDTIFIGDNRVRTNDTSRARPRDPTIWAAMLALNGNVRAYGITSPDPDISGLNGELRIRGALAQKWRGAVGLHNNGTPTRGYEKDYVYDTRLGYVQPPRFIEPTNTSWKMLAWREMRGDASS